MHGMVRLRVIVFSLFKYNWMPARMNTARLSAVIGTTKTLTGLIPFTNYSVQILAYTSAGDGDFSTSVSCSTETDGVGVLECLIQSGPDKYM